MEPQTIGEHAVGVSFNPSGNAQVDDVKRRCADLIDLLEAVKLSNTPGARCAAIAQTGFEEAAMWAVKAITKQPR